MFWDPAAWRGWRLVRGEKDGRCFFLSRWWRVPMIVWRRHLQVRDAAAERLRLRSRFLFGLDFNHERYGTVPTGRASNSGVVWTLDRRRSIEDRHAHHTPRPVDYLSPSVTREKHPSSTMRDDVSGTSTSHIDDTLPCSTSARPAPQIYLLISSRRRRRPLSSSTYLT